MLDDIIKIKIMNHSKLRQIIREEIHKLTTEIVVNKPGDDFQSLLKSYSKYLDSISRAEMFDDDGTYNPTLKKYHEKIKYYAKNGTDEEKTQANFIMGLF